MTIVKRVGVLSCGKIMGCIYGLLGLIIGGLLSLFSLVGAFAAASDQGGFGMLFGVGSIILFPIFYGVIGFVGGIISSALYNLLASSIGGIELELESGRGQSNPLQ